MRRIMITAKKMGMQEFRITYQNSETVIFNVGNTKRKIAEGKGRRISFVQGFSSPFLHVTQSDRSFVFCGRDGSEKEVFVKPVGANHANGVQSAHYVVMV